MNSTKRRWGIAITVLALLVWGGWVAKIARHRPEIPKADAGTYAAVAAHRAVECGNPLSWPGEARKRGRRQ